MRLITFIAAALYPSLVLLSGCAPHRSPDAAKPSAPGAVAGAGFPGVLPASFACVDCGASMTIVQLYPDHTFVHRTEPADAGGASDDIGRWVVSTDGKELLLRGGREAAVRLAIADANRLLPFDPATQQAGPHTLARTQQFVPLEPQLFLRGMYRRGARGNEFIECLTGWSMTVAQEGDAVALEQAMAQVRPPPGQGVLASLEGRIRRAGVPSSAAQAGMSLLPIRFNQLWPGQTCGNPEATESTVMPNKIERSRWSLTASTLTAPVPDETNRVTLEFADGRVAAFSGCNRGGAQYSIEQGTLVIGPMAATKMACMGPGAQFEDEFFAFLASRPKLSADEQTLMLTGPKGELRFAAQLMPSANAVTKFIYVAAQRRPCSGMMPMECLQIREKPSDPWLNHYDEIIGFTHHPGIEYRLRILEDDVPNPPADASSKRWFLDLVVEQKLVDTPTQP
jgi:heat shock protein HslJ